MSHLLVRYILVTHSLLCLCIIIQVFMFIISFLLFLFFVYLFCFFFFFIFFYFFFFFFQAEDGIRDWSVTGVQTCGSSDLSACPNIGRTRTRYQRGCGRPRARPERWRVRSRQPPATQASHWSCRSVGAPTRPGPPAREIGRASCRERV